MSLAHVTPAVPTLPEKFTIVELIDVLGGPSAFARICGFNKNAHARGGDLRRRQSVAVGHWQAVIKAANDAGFPQVTWQSMASAHEMPKASKLKKLPRRKRKSSLV